MATINMHMKFEIEIPRETWLMLRKPCRLQTDGRTDGQDESSIPPPPPPSNFVGRGIINIESKRVSWGISVEWEVYVEPKHAKQYNTIYDNYMKHEVLTCVMYWLDAAQNEVIKTNNMNNKHFYTAVFQS